MAPREQPLQADCRFLFDPRRIWIMGVLNVTSDSFYAGSRFPDSEKSVEHAKRLFREGADVVDIGGESTRPGSTPVSLTEEWSRVSPVIAALRGEFPQAVISIDTQKAQVARQALATGVSILNDVSALRHDPEMASVAASAQVPVVLTHMQGVPETMQRAPHYDDVVDEIKSFFAERIAFAIRRGIAEEKIILDPGIGFGKTEAHNAILLQRLSELKTLGRPLLIGLSRKQFLGRLSSSDPAVLLPPEERLEGTLAANLWAVERGANGLRVQFERGDNSREA
jgi:dihydropteroate synthase